MNYLLAGLASIGIALFWNRFWRHIGLSEFIRMGILIPLGEELSKYSVAYLFQINPFWVSLLFGVGEGIYEMFSITGRPWWLLLSAAVMIHLVLGLGYLTNGGIWPGLAFALILHSGWNIAVYCRK